MVRMHVHAHTHMHTRTHTLVSLYIHTHLFHCGIHTHTHFVSPCGLGLYLCPTQLGPRYVGVVLCDGLLRDGS